MKNQNNFTAEHKKYLLGIKKKSMFINVTRVSILLAFLFIWELAAFLQWVNPFITSSPSRIAKTIAELYQNGTLFYHVGTTLWETLAGFFIAVVLGYSIALLLWWSEAARRISEPYFVVLNALPKIALGPLIIIWFGSGSKAIIFMATLIGIIVAIITMLNGFLETDNNKILLLKSMGASKLQVLSKLVIPGSLPTFISMLKISVGLAWVGSIMGEYLVSRAGLGYLIVYGGQVFKLDLVMSATIVLCILATLMYSVVSLIEKVAIKHR